MTTHFYFAAIRIPDTGSAAYMPGWYLAEGGRIYLTAGEALRNVQANHPALQFRDIRIKRFSTSDIICPTCTHHKHTTKANCHHCCGTGWL